MSSSLPVSGSKSASYLDARLSKRLPSIAGGEGFHLDVHIHASPGITVLLGESGSGKTLTLNCLAGFAAPEQGRILVNEQLYFDAGARVNLRPEQRRCGYLFQEDTLFPHQTLLQNLKFAGTLRRQRGAVLRRRINDLLEVFELSALAKHKPDQLSGGQKQRAALARVLIGDPLLLLLDEPTRGLDARLRAGFYDILRKARERLNVPLLLVSHDLEECFALADTLCLLEQGRLIQVGPTEAVLAHPANLAAARLLRLYAILPAKIQALDPGRNTSLLRILDQNIEGPYFPGHLLGDQGFACIRASELELGPSSTQRTSGQSVLLAAKVRTELAPEGIRIFMDGNLTLTLPHSRLPEIQTSDRLPLHIPPASINFLTR